MEAARPHPCGGLFVFMFTYFKIRRFRKAMKGIATVVLNDFVIIGSEVVAENKHESKNNELFEEVLKLESMIFLFWFVKTHPILQDKYAHRLFLDYLHEEYYAAFKRNGYSFGQRKVICDLLNERYQEYDSAIDDDNFSAIAAKLCIQLSEKSGTPLNMANITIVLQLLERVEKLLRGYRQEFFELGVYTKK
jgi:hypothetical protein